MHDELYIIPDDEKRYDSPIIFWKEKGVFIGLELAVRANDHEF